MIVTPQDLALLNCNTYEDYLDSFITHNDIRYLRNLRSSRMLVQLGYRSPSEVYTQEEFELRKAAVREAICPTKKSAILFSDGMRSSDPVLLQLAAREKANTQKIISTIIFLMHRLKSGFDVSGYIDFEHSLRRANLLLRNSTDWMGVFNERTMLRPKRNHLSYFNWHKGVVRFNDSDNYMVLHDVDHGLIFMHKGDHKKICINIAFDLLRSNCMRSMHYSEKYGHVIFYDHIVRKKI